MKTSFSIWSGGLMLRSTAMIWAECCGTKGIRIGDVKNAHVPDRILHREFSFDKQH